MSYTREVMASGTALIYLYGAACSSAVRKFRTVVPHTHMQKCSNLGCILRIWVKKLISPEVFFYIFNHNFSVTGHGRKVSSWKCRWGRKKLFPQGNYSLVQSIIDDCSFEYTTKDWEGKTKLGVFVSVQINCCGKLFFVNMRSPSRKTNNLFVWSNKDLTVFYTMFKKNPFDD